MRLPTALTASSLAISETPCVPVSVRLSGPYYFRSINRLIRELQPLFAMESPDTIDIDMSGLTFMGPTALALTTAAIHQVRTEKSITGGYLTPPSSKGAATYLHRIDFYKTIFEEQQVADVVDRRPTTGMVECRHFGEGSDLTQNRDVVVDLVDAVAELVETTQASRASLDLCLSEITENVVFHADTLHGGFVAAQHLRHSGVLELGIVDMGQGICRSLTQNEKYAGKVGDDLDAIQVAMTPTVTATPERNSGYGLAFTELLLKLNGGQLLVRSGRGHVQRGASEADRVVDMSLPGTLVAMRFNTDEPFNYKKAYDLLEKAVADILRTDDHS